MVRSLAALAAALVLALAGCGGDDEESGSNGSAPTATPTETAAASDGGGGGGEGGGETLTLSSPEDGSLSFDKTELTAPAGTVTIEYDNPSSTPHAVEIEGNGVEEASETVTGDSTSVSADLEAGEYTFYCPVGNHRAGGMEGTLTVE
jgi:plastocyanin